MSAAGRSRAAAADNGPPDAARPGAVATDRVSHNLAGQKLGRKGRDTRERIVAATAALLAEECGEAISLTAVARRASLGMSSLYNYFTDLTELLLAVLDPVMATAECGYMAVLRERWPDEALDERCYRFIRAYYDFWSRHSRLLHLRNSMADSRDRRMVLHRVNASQPVIRLLTAQLGGDADASAGPAIDMATVLTTVIERTVTVATDDYLTALFGATQRRHEDHYLRPLARLMELAIRDTRAALRDGAPGEG